MKRCIALSIAAFAVPCAAFAQHAPSSLVNGNMSLVSEYRFRGIDQTFGKPALQGGFDYTHSSGLYLGNWNSNVNQGARYPGGNLEMDFYGGYKKAFRNIGLDVGLIYYYYPGSDAALLGAANPHSANMNSGTVHNTEPYVGVSWKWLSLKWFHAISDYFMIPDTQGTNYYELSATYDMGGGWALVGDVGTLKAHGYTELNYTDYKLGVTKDLRGWLAGVSLIGTNAKGSCPFNATSSPYCFANGSGTQTKDAGRTTVVLSVGKSF